MYDYELSQELKNFLINHIDIIKESLENAYVHYDFIKINSVDIDDDMFSIHCQLFDGVSSSISPYMPIPEQFIRKYKLKKINETNEKSGKLLW